MRWMANSRIASVVVALVVMLTANTGRADSDEKGTAAKEQTASAEPSSEEAAATESSTGAETQPAETQPAETQPAETQPAETQSSETTQGEAKQTAAADEAKSNEAQPAPVDPLTANRHYMLQLHNSQRARYSLRPFRMNGKLNRAAQRFAEFMGRTRSFGHYADGRSPAHRVAAEGYNHSSWAENIAWVGNRPNDAMNTWMNSSGHRVNVLSGHSEVGFGLYNGIWVAVFANPSAFEVQRQQVVGGE